MAQDTEEALRVLLMIGNAVIPAGRDIIRLLARVSSNVARTGWKGGKMVVGRSLDHIDGCGSTGWVRSANKLSGQVQTVDITDRLDRPDLHQIATLCRQAGAAFSVCELKQENRPSRTLLQFSASNASTMQAVLGAALASNIVTEADLDEACTEPKVGNGPISYGGRTWEPAAGDPGALSTTFNDAAGKPMTAVARPDGSWSVNDATGKPALIGAEPIAGKADQSFGESIGGALAACSSRIAALTDPQIYRENARLATGYDRMRTMSAKDVTLSACRTIQCKNRAAKPGVKPGVKPDVKPNINIGPKKR